MFCIQWFKDKWIIPVQFEEHWFLKGLFGSKLQNNRTLPEAYLNELGLKASHAEDKAGLNHMLRSFNA